MQSTESQDTTESAERKIKLTVVSGPDAGLCLSFQQPEIQVGRAPDNDFVLSDGFVSGEHGVFRRTSDGEIVYCDLESRHGSLVVIDDVSHRLHEEGRSRSGPIGRECELQVGCSLIQVEITHTTDTESKIELSDSEPKLESTRLGRVGEVDEQRDKVITQSLEPVQSINRRFENDNERLAILFRLAGELNGRTGLDDILDLVGEATFDAFPNANFFAITLVSQPDEVAEADPFFTRIRGDLPGSGDGSPIISTSILEHVVERQESVLFLKDATEAEVSESILQAEITSCLCAPLVGQSSLLGVMEVDTRGEGGGGVFSRRDLDLFSVLASNVAFAIERAELSSNIVEMFESFVAASVNAIEARDPSTAGHSERVTEYTLEFADVVDELEREPFDELQFDDDEIKELRYAALLHDFGKIAVDEAILQKSNRLTEEELEVVLQRLETIKARDYQTRLQGRLQETDRLDDDAVAELDRAHRSFCDELDEAADKIESIARAPALEDDEIEWVRDFAERTYVDDSGGTRPFLEEHEVESLTIRYGTLDEAEWKAIRAHPAHSKRYLERIPWSDELGRIPRIAGAHHEKLDGSGYPYELEGDEIIPQVRMLTIADIFDALTANDRPYRDAYSIERAVDILEAEASEGKLDADLVELFVADVLPRIRDQVPDRN